MSRLTSAVVLALSLQLSGCGRLGFGLDTLDSAPPDADILGDAHARDTGVPEDGSVGDGSAEVDGSQPDAAFDPTVFIDDFDRADSSTLGSEWVVRASAMALFSIRSNRLVYTRGNTDDVQEMVWYSRARDLDQWACFQFVSSPYNGFYALSVGFRGEPGGEYVALSAHPETDPDPIRRSEARYESIRDEATAGMVAPPCAGAVSSGVMPGDWLCGAIQGPASGAPSVRFWRFTSDPGVDAAAFPAATCEWTIVGDLDGAHLGIGVWSTVAPQGIEIVLDNFRGGSL